ncbi:hypothetical protein N7G274_003078 [Stereocaulon virgatum]|uniref:Uncharacterized protein n=1 Tax=Stereocaulon virgatum TaxID=373712 RepID=A0ABR4AH14_9LECA
MSGEQRKDTVPDRTQDTASTVSSDCGDTAESSQGRKASGYPTHETDPTSRASEVLDDVDRKPPPSDEADPGSDFIRSDTDSSSSSDNSRKALSEPSARERVEAVGSHLAADVVGLAGPTELDFDPRNADEARAAFTRIGSIHGTILAFDNNEPIRSYRDDEPYQLSVQVARNTHDIEQQQEEVERVKKDMRACTKTIAVVGIFATLAFLLYGHATKV